MKAKRRRYFNDVNIAISDQELQEHFANRTYCSDEPARIVSFKPSRACFHYMVPCLRKYRKITCFTFYVSDTQDPEYKITYYIMYRNDLRLTLLNYFIDNLMPGDWTIL